MTDGFRDGFSGAADVSPRLSPSAAGGRFALPAFLIRWLFKSGYQLRSWTAQSERV